ncbi:MAG: DUF255 domain-containing protein [Planctomycetota bacterium]|jgi:uncharacterized protein YyaL (SSP411 family)
MGKEFDSQNTPAGQSPDSVPASVRRKPARTLWIIAAVFFAFVIFVFVSHREETINWVRDYETGLELARKRKKPVLLAFYKQFTRYTTDTFENTYKNAGVIEYVEANFIPILIDVDEHPDIAELYEVGYYPSHFIKRPDGNDVFGPLIGYDPPALFITKLKNLLSKMESAGK